MMTSKFNIILLIFIVGTARPADGECLSPFVKDEVTKLCYYYKEAYTSWVDGYNQCLSKTIDGVLIQLHTRQQFNNLKSSPIGGRSIYWIGANNFGSFRDSYWHWIDGSIVDDSVITWCANSTYDVAIGAYCAAYDSTLQCVTSYLCSSALPSPCVSVSGGRMKQGKASLAAVLSTVIGCTNSYAGSYANWWTYSTLVLNWFFLFCTVLYLSNHFNINKKIVLIIVSFVILSMMAIIAFAILWGVQYQDIVQMPLIIVVLGSGASIFFLIDMLVLLSNRTHVQKWILCLTLTIITICLEILIMLGIILCIAHCSAFISLGATSLDKDIIASLLSSVLVSVSVVFVYGILFLVGNTGQDRVHVVPAVRQNPNISAPATTKQSLIPRTTPNKTDTNAGLSAKKSDKVERATSPVDQRIIDEFYLDRPKDLHQYSLEGRQYVVYEGLNLTDCDSYRRELTQAMLLQEQQGLNEAILRAKSSIYASSLAEEIRQAESLVSRLK